MPPQVHSPRVTFLLLLTILYHLTRHEDYLEFQQMRLFHMANKSLINVVSLHRQVFNKFNYILKIHRAETMSNKYKRNSLIKTLIIYVCI